MKQIITCNVYRDYNFGGPSILLGINELMRLLLSENFKIINLEARENVNKEDEIFPMRTVHHALPGKRSIFRCILGGNGIIGIGNVLKYLKDADLVIDLLGICFCDNLVQNKISKWRAIQRATNVFFISWLAKKVYNKKIIKNPAHRAGFFLLGRAVFALYELFAENRP